MWGTCQGFEVISIMLSGNNSILGTCDGCANVTGNNYFYSNYSSKMFDGMPSDMKQLMATANLSYFDHVQQLDVDAYKYNPLLEGNITAITWTYSGTNEPYVTSFESPQYPIYATQFHQEKSTFEWRMDLFLDINRSYDAVRLEQYLANFFVNECRKNFNVFSDTDNSENEWMLIYNYNATQVPASIFTQVYLFLDTNITQYEVQKSYH